VKFSVRERDLGSAVLEAQQKVAQEVKLPSGYRLEWAGDFVNFENAVARLAIAVPIAIALILLLLYVSFGSLVDTLIAGSAIPMALVGGILDCGLADMSVQHLGRHRLRGPVRHRRHERHHGGRLLHRLIGGGLEREAALAQTCELQMRPGS
jgi:cobalt-zinc-cadmium resistance protein CzcA